MNEKTVSHVDRTSTPNPLFKGFEDSNIVEATVKNVNVDDQNNVTFTVDVVTIKGEVKRQVPCLFPWASVDGVAGIFSVPQVGDKCLVALGAGNLAYLLGYHPSAQLSQAKASQTLLAAGQPAGAEKGTFAQSQMLPGTIEIKSSLGNRVLIHPGGSIAIDARVDLFTFYDAVTSTIESMCRSYQLLTAGGQMLWVEGNEKTKRSMKFQADLFTKSATQENLAAGATRGGKKLLALFDEDHDLVLQVTDSNGVQSTITIGSNGVILSSGSGPTQGSIVVSPTGNFSLSAGDPNGIHTELDLSPEAIAISALNGPEPMATVQALASGQVNMSAETEVELQTDGIVSVIGTEVFLGELGGIPVARLGDQVTVFGVTTGPSNAEGTIMTGSFSVLASL